MEIDLSNISKKIDSFGTRTINTDNLLELQKIEDMIRDEKMRYALDLYQKNNRLNLETFLRLIKDLSSYSQSILEYYYFIKHTYDYDKTIGEKRRAQMYVIAPHDYISSTDHPIIYTDLQTKLARLVDNNKSFLFYATDDDKMFADIVKTPNEIILPYGNSIKYYRGERYEDTDRAIRLATDTANKMDFPVTLKLH